MLRFTSTKFEPDRSILKFDLEHDLEKLGTVLLLWGEGPIVTAPSIHFIIHFLCFLHNLCKLGCYAYTCYTIQELYISCSQAWITHTHPHTPTYMYIHKPPQGPHTYIHTYIMYVGETMMLESGNRPFKGAWSDFSEWRYLFKWCIITQEILFSNFSWIG